MAGAATTVIPLHFVDEPRGDAVIEKAVSDFGAMGNAMSDAAISSARYNEYRTWQQHTLRDAAIHWWLYKSNPWVRTCVDLIAQRATADDYAIKSASGDETAIEAATVVFSRVNPKQSLDRILRGVYRDLQINGNWYGRVQFQGSDFVALYRVDFRTIVPKPEQVGPPQTYLIYENGRMDYSPTPVPVEQIIHLTLNDAGENWCGLSPLESLDFTLANDQAAIAYNTGFFQNGAKAGDIYQMDSGLGKEQVEAERQYLKENFTKPSQSFEPLLLQGDTKLLRDGSSIRKDMEFVKLREWNREEVAAVYSVPLSLISAQMGALGANGKEQDAMLFKESVVAPLQKQVFEDLQRELVEERMDNSDLTLEPPKVAGVRLENVQTAVNMTQTGATLNQARAVMNLPTIDDPQADVPLFRGQRTTLVGIPGDPKAILITDQGANSADPNEQSEELPPTAPVPGKPPAPVQKADQEAPEWIQKQVSAAMDRMMGNANRRRNHFARLIGGRS